MSRSLTYLLVVTATAATLTAGPAAEAAGTGVPAGFQPASSSFVSARTAFVLGAVGCLPGHVCRARLAATSDAGARWRSLPAPSGATTADSVFFATARIGWIYGPRLWVTRNGGGHWNELATAGHIDAMAAGGGRVYAVVVPPKSATGELLRSPLHHNTWEQVHGVSVAASYPLPGFATSGRSIWLMSGGPVWTTSGSGWHEYPVTCTGSRYSPAGVAAASPSDVDFLCLNFDFDTGHEGMEVMASTDGGQTEHLAGRKAPVIGDGGSIAVPPGRPRIITFAASPGIPSVLSRSADGGRTWRRIGLFGNGPWISLTYVTAATGWVELGRAGLGGSPELLRTTDAGAHWRPVPIS